MAKERNYVVYAADPDEIARYLNLFGVGLKLEGSHPVHWCAERDRDTIHVCQERRSDPLRYPDEPGIHGLWHFITHEQHVGPSA